MTSIFEATKITIGSNRNDIDQNIRELRAQLARENTLLPENLSGAVQRVLAVYGMLKPLLSILMVLPILPGIWRDGIKYLNQVLDALSIAAEKNAAPETPMDPDATANFKAGKDLEPAA
jgi:hypothetical protein